MMSNPPSPHGSSAARRNVARRSLALLRAGTDVRHDLVRRVRERIRAGSYENELKLAVAAERLMRDLPRR